MTNAAEPGVDPSQAKQLAEQAYRLAYDYEQKYGSCPQCVLASVWEVLGIGNNQLFKASYCLAGGGALSTKGTCGALAGAMLAVGARYGRDRADFDKGSQMHAQRLAKKVFDAFVAEFGSPTCADIQTQLMGRAFDLWNQKEFEASLAAGAHDDKCTHVAGTAARIAVEVLLEAEGKNTRQPQRPKRCSHG